MPMETMPAIVNQAKNMPVRIQPYTVTQTQHLIQNVRQPIMQPVIQPVIQRVVRQPQTVINTQVERRIQPVIEQQVRPQYETVVEDGKGGAPIHTTPVIQEEHLAPIMIQHPVAATKK